MHITFAVFCFALSISSVFFSQFPIGEGYHLKDVLHSNIHMDNVTNKIIHIKRISQETGIAPNEMVFFDNQLYDCQDVSKINVTVAYVPKGLTRYVQYPTEMSVGGYIATNKI